MHQRNTVQNRPDSVHELFERCLNEADHDGLMALYEDSAAFVDRTGKAVSGVSAIGEFLDALLTAKPRIVMRRMRTIDAGDICILVSHWELSGTETDGSSFSEAGTTYDVVRRGSDGIWRMAVNSPWGSSWTEKAFLAVD